MKRMKIPETERLRTAVNSYLENLKIDGKAATTYNGYKNKLEMFCRWFEASDRADWAPDTAAIIDYKEHMAAKGRTANTIAQNLIILHTFFEWASDPEMPWGYEHNPVLSKLIPHIKQNSAPYAEFLTEEDVAKILKAPQKRWGVKSKSLRNYAMLTLFLTTGLRASELRSLTIDNIDFENSRLFITGKGEKFRVVALPDIGLTAILKYLNSEYRPLHLKTSDYLFGSLRNGEWSQLTHAAVYAIVEKYVETSVGKSVSPHKLRHVYSRLLLQNGAPAEEIQSMLGHSNLKTTQLYTGRLLLPTRNSTAFKVFGDMAEISA